MKKRNEKQLRNSLFEKIRNIAPEYTCGMEVPVPYQHVYVPEGRMNLLQIWCFKQDIVFYRPLFTKDIGYKESRIVDANSDPVVQVVLEKDTAQNSRDVAMPFVIIETKRRQPNSHDILTYSNKFEKIKTIFPFCKFVFCVFERIAPRTYRHGANFDEIVSITSTKSYSELSYLKKTILRLLRRAQADLQKLQERSNKTK